MKWAYVENGLLDIAGIAWAVAKQASNQASVRQIQAITKKNGLLYNFSQSQFLNFMFDPVRGEFGEIVI